MMGWPTQVLNMPLPRYKGQAVETVWVELSWFLRKLDQDDARLTPGQRLDWNGSLASVWKVHSLSLLGPCRNVPKYLGTVNCRYMRVGCPSEQMTGMGLEKVSLAESVRRYKGPDIAKEHLYALLTHPRVMPSDACR